MIIWEYNCRVTIKLTQETRVIHSTSASQIFQALVAHLHSNSFVIFQISWIKSWFEYATNIAAWYTNVRESPE